MHAFRLLIQNTSLCSKNMTSIKYALSPNSSSKTQDKAFLFLHMRTEQRDGGGYHTFSGLNRLHLFSRLHYIMWFAKVKIVCTSNHLSMFPHS
jgi:hypothetical protein